MVRLKVEAQAQAQPADKYRKADGTLRAKYARLKDEVLAAMEALDPERAGLDMSYPDIQTLILRLVDYKGLKPEEMPSSADVKEMCAELAREGKVVD